MDFVGGQLKWDSLPAMEQNFFEVPASARSGGRYCACRSFEGKRNLTYCRDTTPE